MFEGFLAILIWLGSGFAFAVGFMAGMLVLGLMVKKGKPTEQEVRVNDLLEARNLIGEKEVDAMCRIAEAIEQLQPSA